MYMRGKQLFKPNPRDCRASPSPRAEFASFHGSDREISPYRDNAESIAAKKRALKKAKAAMLSIDKSTSFLSGKEQTSHEAWGGIAFVAAMAIPVISFFSGREFDRYSVAAMVTLALASIYKGISAIRADPRSYNPRLGQVISENGKSRDRLFDLFKNGDFADSPLSVQVKAIDQLGQRFLNEPDGKTEEKRIDTLLSSGNVISPEIKTRLVKQAIANAPKTGPPTHPSASPTSKQSGVRVDPSAPMAEPTIQTQAEYEEREGGSTAGAVRKRVCN